MQFLACGRKIAAKKARAFTLAFVGELDSELP
jgi:hypothetical protein